MRRLVAIALVACCSASSQAQRVAPVGTTDRSAAVDLARVLPRSMRGHVAPSPASAPTPPATVDDGRHGSAWMWVALGTLAGGVIGGSAMKAHCSRQPGSCAEFSVPLVTVLGGIGGGLVGAVTFRLSRQGPGASAPSSMTGDAR